MTITMKRISVTAQNIKKAVPGDCCNCPIALALLRATGREIKVSSAVFYDWGKEIKVVIPPKVRKFIELFDSGKPVKPITFEYPDLTE